MLRGDVGAGCVEVALGGHDGCFEGEDRDFFGGDYMAPVHSTGFVFLAFRPSRFGKPGRSG